MPFMWADTLQAAERAHLLRLLIWGAASVLAGTAVVAWLKVAARRSPLLWQFAIQSILWGSIEVVLGVVWLARVSPRDLAAATRLDRMLWLNIGLDVGYVMGGFMLALAAWRLKRALGGVGAGIGIVVQGLALALLDLVLAAQITR